MRKVPKQITEYGMPTNTSKGMEIIGKFQACEVYNGETKSITG
jgi:hypothetical protein